MMRVRPAIALAASLALAGCGKDTTGLILNGALDYGRTHPDTVANVVNDALATLKVKPALVAAANAQMQKAASRDLTLACSALAVAKGYLADVAGKYRLPAAAAKGGQAADVVLQAYCSGSAPQNIGQAVVLLGKALAATQVATHVPGS